MPNKTIAFGCDHAGLILKASLIDLAESLGFRVIDLGTNSPDSVDYPDYANKVVSAITSNQVTMGVLLCGTGIGMCMAANRHPGIRAALCHTEFEARVAREHNDANILCLGGRTIGPDLAKSCFAAFLGAHFMGGRHTQRVEKMG